jgi:F0F1-type ATP synthase membrane subunit c/vacuolar-type H+-ATPase subunit K
MLLAAAPMAHVLRSQIFKKHWQGNVVTPKGFLTGTILFLALFEGVSLFSLVVVLLSGTFWPYIVPSAVALAVQAANFPTGRVMQVDEPQLLHRP